MTEGLQKVSGQIVSIDHQRRTVLIRYYDEKKFEVSVPLKWTPGLDGKMGKLKEKFFQTFLYQGEQIDDAHYFAKPADWPQQSGGNKSGWQGKPRNDKAIMLQSNMKVCAEVFCHCTQAQSQDFEAAMDTIKTKAISLTNEMMKEAGA